MESLFLLITLSTLLSCAAADKTNFAILNLTPYAWSRAGSPHSYQMEHWQDTLPATLASNTVHEAVIQIQHGIKTTASDDAGEFYWTVHDGTDNTIALKLDVSGNFVDYTVHLHAEFEGIRFMNDTSSIDVGFIDSDHAWTPFILAGDVGSYVGNRPPSDWMHQNLPYLGCLNLQQMIIPGTHDSGISKVQYSTFGSGAANTQTQTLDVEGQLNAGARYFDIRPAISHGDYYTGHYDHVCLLGACSWQGSIGQSMDEIIDNINSFTASNDELVILYLSDTKDTDADYDHFDDDQTTALLHRLERRVKHLWRSDTTEPLTTIPLKTFISAGPAVVVVLAERDTAWLSSHGFTGRGFFPGSAFPKFDDYADTDDLDAMRRDQYAKLVAQTQRKKLLQEQLQKKKQSQSQSHSATPSDSNPDPNPDPDPQAEAVFVLSWTATLRGAANALPVDKITARADGFNARLAQLSGTPPLTSPFLWARGMQGLPNVVLVDNLRDDRYLAALALAYTRLYSRCGA